MFDAARMPDPKDTPQQYWHIRVRPRTPQLDGNGRAVLHDARQAGFEHIEGVRSSRLYLLWGRLSAATVQQLARNLFTDSVAEVCHFGAGLTRRDDSDPAVEVRAKPGVMDPVAASATTAARRYLKTHAPDETVDAVQTARRYEIVGATDAAELQSIASRVLANDCIESWFIHGFDRSDPIPDTFPEPPGYSFELRHVSLLGLSDDALTKMSRTAHLFLSLDELRTIRDYFEKAGRDPTDLEIETLAQTWSEHCVHKTLKSAIEYRGQDFGRPGSVEVRFDNLLKDTIMRATAELKRDWCLSVFVDNAGIIAFDDEFALACKVETHNHPSAIEPYGGAATGIGGCIRDIMGCGLGAKPIASTDVFCLAPPDYDTNRLPKDVLHPRRVLKGVVSGVRDYGNRMGIPTVNGAIHFDERFLCNPLVYCGCVGLIPRNRITKKAMPGDRIVVAGGRTGRDGIHGATFSSAELTDQHADEFAHAVQIGNAIEEKKVLDALLLARDHASGCLYSAVTDCGAGGLSSAVGEMGEEIGAEVDLEQVPLKYAGLRYDEIWISEAQERMVFSVPPDRLETFLAVFAEEEVDATVIGTFRDDRMLRVRFEGKVVGELDMGFLHDGLPKTRRTATWSGPAETNPPAHSWESDAKHLPHAKRLLAALRDLNIASKEWVIRQYDHEVQGRSVIKPLAGPGSGPSDAAVLRPLYDSDRGVAIGCGMCLEWSDRDPYWMAIFGVDEALRNVICVGADPERIAILDNFCWPKVDTEESLGALVRACKGASDAAIAWGTPFISGKDSLNNEFTMSKEEAARTGLPSSMAIPYTLLITAMGIVPDVRRCATSDLKRAGNFLVLASAPVNDVGFETAHTMHRQVSRLIQTGKVIAAHDVSDGGLSVAIAEMCIAGEVGASLDVPEKVYTHCVFANVATTYLLEMNEPDAKDSGLPVIGRVEQDPRLRIVRHGGVAIDLPVSELASAWREPLAAWGGE